MDILQITNSRWIDHWQKQAYTVMLVTRTADWEIRWMNVSTYLKRESTRGKKAVKQIVFQGERLDVMSVRRWRDRMLAGQPAAN